MKFRHLICIGVLGFLWSCQSDSNTTVAKRDFSPAFQKTLDAHGGLGKWNEMKMLKFTKGKGYTGERHMVDLRTRKSRIEVTGRFVLGHDGENVWVSPHRDSFPGKSPRFVHNLQFYFVALPFVLADPGVNLEDLGMKEVDSVAYQVIKATFDDGVGDAPDDHYILYTNPETGIIDFINYSVTFFDKAKATKYNALKFEWKDANGLLFPEKTIGYKWENNQLGEQRYTNTFTKFKYTTDKINDYLFEVPNGAFKE